MASPSWLPVVLACMGIVLAVCSISLSVISLRKSFAEERAEKELWGDLD